MKNKLSVVLAGVVVLLLVSSSLSAHHSDSAYDTSQHLTMNGTVTEFDWTNPHVLIRFEVKDDKGKVESWIGEGSPPNTLSRSGWSRNSIKPGDQITVTGSPYRDGRKGIRIDAQRPLLVNGKAVGQAEY